MKVALDIRSHFSLGESLLTLEDIAAGVERAGYEAAALCDTMSINGMPDFTRAMEKIGVKPIIGCRLRIVPTLERERKVAQVYPKLYILDERGLAIVMRLLTLANDDEHFYYRPRLVWEDVLDAIKDACGSLAFASGTLHSALKDSRATDVLRSVSASLSAKYTFSEIVAVDSPVWDRQALEAVRVAKALGLPTLLSRPTLYNEPGQDDALGIMSSIIMNNRKVSSENFRSHVRDYCWKTPIEIVEGCRAQILRLRAHDDAAFSADHHRASIEGARNLADAVEFRWTKMPLTLPKMADDEDAELRERVKLGFADRVRTGTFADKLSDRGLDVYVKRLKYELEVLTKMGFSGYFLLTSEIVNWAKSNGIMVGPGRGSVGGSLVAYSLGITDVDPIRFGLLFERFINPDRVDLPDADLDFMSTRRHEVLQHIEATYGRDRVAGISNYSKLASGLALRDVARISGLSVEEMNTSKHIPDEHGTPISLERALEESQAVAGFASRNPDEWRFACALEGRVRALARHAAGIVVSGEPLVNRAVVELRKGEPTINWDKRIVEDMGLVKMDILGLATLDLIKLATDMVRERTGKSLNLIDIPLDDEKVLSAFGAGYTIGVFQFESAGMRKLLKSLATGGPLTFEDISAATALYRPGPMDSGLLEDFVSIKQGFMEPYYEHPAMKPALEETYSVIVYQEQVMRIATDLCGFSLTEADHLRKAIGKKDPVKMASMSERFISGAVENGMNEGKAQELWDKIVKFAGYAFNKSHSVEYSLISYQSMWLKVYHPVEFYAAALTVLGDEKMPSLLADARDRGIEVLPPDVNVSTTRFEILNDSKLAAPFSVVKGISDNGANAILKARDAGPFESKDDFCARAPRRLVNITRVRALDEIGAFARIEPGTLPADHPDRKAALLEWCPSIVMGGATVTRDIPRDKVTIAHLKRILDELRASDSPIVEGAILTTPRFGKRAKFMVVTDGPTWTEEREGQFTKGDGFRYVADALLNADLDVDDGYWTGLCKVPKSKGAKLYTTEQINAFMPTLKAEIELLNPQVLVLLGSTAVRQLVTSLRGAPADHAGKVVYQKATEDKDDDRNIVIGINPGMISFDGAKQELLDEVFRIVKDMVG